jgi:hypothetical protein
MHKENVDSQEETNKDKLTQLRQDRANTNASAKD